MKTQESPRLGEHVGDVSPRSVKPFWRRRFLKVYSSKKIIAAKPWPMTSQVENFLFLMDRQSYLQSFASICSAVSDKKIFEGFNVKNNMAAEPHDQWHHQFFPPFNLAWDDPHNFSHWSVKAFDICNYDVKTKPPMTSSKITYYPPPRSGRGI